MGLAHFMCLLTCFSVILLITASEGENEYNLPCNVTETARVQYEFNTDIISSEHIITFKGYFPRKTRENYITAALKNAGVSLYSNYKVLISVL